MLADDDRRRVLAALVLGAVTVADVKDATGLDTRAAATALVRLAEAELVVPGEDGRYFLLGAAYRRAAIAAAPPRPGPDGTDDAPDDVARVLRSFFREGRLVRMPSKRSQRLLVLDRLAQEFEIGHRFVVSDVNAVLRRFHDDVAAIRRYLVDEGFMDRDAGQYWRSGGSYR